MAVSDKCKKQSKDIFSVAFMPKDTIDQPCDVILVVEDGKQFKAHRQVLSEASPFFEKLLNSDMKESNEGVVRLELFSESVMENTLEFIYTGNVQTLTEDSARDLIVMADYLFQHNLKTLAERVLIQSLNITNCFSNYYLSERYRCEELFSKTQKFILANFSAAYAANRIEVLNMSSREIEMFISSDEINVNEEEDAFNVILSWIDHDKSNRKKYFPEFFRHVRLVYLSRDFLCNDIVTNDLVRDSEGCLDLVEDAVKLIESKDFSNLSVTPRKSLETSVIVIERRENILFYFPREDKWCSLGSSFPEHSCSREFVSCRGNLFIFDHFMDRVFLHSGMHSGITDVYKFQLIRYNPFSNKWMLICSGDKTKRHFVQIFVTKQDEMFTLEYEQSREEEEKYVFFITKYKAESNSWEDISSFEHLGRFPRRSCIVTKDDFIYFIGGIYGYGINWEPNFLTDVYRYDLRKDQWSKVADVHEGCWYRGAVVNERIFVAGQSASKLRRPYEKDEQLLKYHCEVYDETTDEWQVVASLNGGLLEKLLVLDDKLYAVCSVMFKLTDTCVKVECYDPVNDKWNLKNEGGTLPALPSGHATVCSMRIYKEFLADYQLENFIPRPRSSGKCKCFIM